MSEGFLLLYTFGILFGVLVLKFISDVSRMYWNDYQEFKLNFKEFKRTYQEWTLNDTNRRPGDTDDCENDTWISYTDGDGNAMWMDSSLIKPDMKLVSYHIIKGINDG